MKLPQITHEVAEAYFFKYMQGKHSESAAKIFKAEQPALAELVSTIVEDGLDGDTDVWVRGMAVMIYSLIREQILNDEFEELMS